MPAATPPSPHDFLMPNGKPIGKRGTKGSIRELPGGHQAATDFFEALAAGGKLVAMPGYPGEMIEFPSGGRVGLRAKSKSRKLTIDVDIPGIPIKKIKFVG